MSIDQETLIKLRKVEVEILDEFVRICEKNNFIYFLAYGTLLGAVRHKGFIPWDDDIDVAMPRNDYERFLDLFKENIDPNYCVLSYKCAFNTSFRCRYFARLCKKHTVYAQNHINPKNYPGIFIDIWPYDKSIPMFLPIQIKLIAISDKLYHLKTNAYITQNKIKRFFRKLICILVPLRFSKIFLKETFQVFNRLKTQHITFIYCESIYYIKTHKYSTIFPLTTVCFEEKYYKAPGKWDTFLKTTYGNYMELPPVEQRQTHNINYIIFDDKDI